jgi:hypothetical protein
MAKTGKNTSLTEGVRRGIRASQQGQFKKQMDTLMRAGQQESATALRDQRVGEWDLSPASPTGASEPAMAEPMAVTPEVETPVRFGDDDEHRGLMIRSMGGSRHFTKREVKQGFRRL